MLQAIAGGGLIQFFYHEQRLSGAEKGSERF